MHKPVMLKESLEYLAIKPGATVIDANVGPGGHAARILEAIGTKGRLLGIDRDRDAIVQAQQNLAKYHGQITLIHDRFSNLSDIALGNDFTDVDGILFDLGVSSLQLDTPGRGFSWRREEPLDMRMNQSRGLTAAELLQASSEEDLKKIFSEYGEERFSPQLAKAIVEERDKQPLKTTSDLIRVIDSVIPEKFRSKRIHPATKIFQAIRIAVNNELGEIELALPQTLNLLKPGGRLVAISFHSLEDRIVKKFMRLEEKDCICPPEMPVCRCQHKAALKILTKKPVVPTVGETKDNSRARSAKLRAAKKI